MKRKVLIEKKENHVWTFFLEEDQIAEIHCAKSDEQEKVHQIGDIYVAKVQNIVQNIGAAFLEIEPGVNCYFDLRDAQNAFFTHKIGKKPLCIGDELVVQISREAAGRIFSALAHAHINVKMIDQGSSELNIIVGVRHDDFKNAIKALYEIFVLTQI